MDARRDWTVIGLSPDGPNEVARLVYRNRLRFAVGAGSRDDRALGVQKLPCLVILRAGANKPEIHQAPEHALRGLLGDETSSGPASGWTLPADLAELGPHTPDQVLRRCAFDSPSRDVRLAAVRLLQTRLEPEALRELADELMVAEPPQQYAANYNLRVSWYSGWLARALGMDLDFRTPEEQRPDRIDQSLAEAYKLTMPEKTVAQLAQDYVDYTQAGVADALIRSAILTHLCTSVEEQGTLQPDAVLPLMPSLLAAEPYAGKRQLLVWFTGELWEKATGDYTSLVIPMLESCLGPQEHIVVRVTAREVLERVAEGRP